MPKLPRLVRIELIKETYCVFYVERKAGCRHMAAQFYAPDTTEEKIVQWINDNPKLQLAAH